MLGRFMSKRLTLKNVNVSPRFQITALGLASKPESRKRMQLAEIKNGRLAMCAIGGAIHHALLTHQGMFEVG